MSAVCSVHRRLILKQSMDVENPLLEQDNIILPDEIQGFEPI